MWLLFTNLGVALQGLRRDLARGAARLSTGREGTGRFFFLFLLPFQWLPDWLLSQVSVCPSRKKETRVTRGHQSKEEERHPGRGVRQERAFRLVGCHRPPLLGLSSISRHPLQTLTKGEQSLLSTGR